MKYYNVLIDGRNFRDQPINDLIKQYNEVKKTSTRQGDDCTTKCLLDSAYFKDNYKLIVVYLSKQKALDADPREIQQIIFQGIYRQKLRLYTLFLKNQKKQYWNFTKEQ